MLLSPSSSHPGSNRLDPRTLAPSHPRFALTLLIVLLPLLGSAASVAAAAKTLAEALDELQQEAGFSLVYSSQTVTPDMLVEREPTAGDLPGRLRQLLAPHGLAARPLPGGGYAIVRAIDATRSGSLEVLVRLAPTGHAIAGARVRVAGQRERVETDAHGYARLGGLAPGSYALTVGADCCLETVIAAVAVAAHAATRLEVDLEPLRQTAEEIVVHASRYAFARETAASAAVLPRGDLTLLPAVEEDAMRVLQRLPGTAASGLSARSHVRGGYEDELLVLFDGVRLYNPFHLKDFQGLFGLIDPETLDSVEYYSGGFPAWYGGRSGGVMDISPRQAEGMQTLLGLSFLVSRLISSGEAFEGRGQWLAGYRRSNLGAVIRSLERDVGEPEFEDFVLRYQHDLGPDTQLTIGLLGLNDRLDLFTEDRSEVATASYRDRYIWAAVEHQWSERLSTRLRFNDARLSARRFGDMSRPGIGFGELEDRRETDIDLIGVDFTLTPATGLRVHWGLEASDVSAQYDYRSVASFAEPLAATFGQDAFEERAFTGAPDGRVYAGYLTGRLELGRWLGELGVRWDRATYLDDGDIWSPRISLRRDLGAATTLRVTAGRYAQFQSINELDAEDAEPLFAEPESSWHTIVGLEHDFDTTLMLRAEAFYKRTNNVRSRFESQLDPLVLLPEVEVDRVPVAPRNARTWGLELSVQSRARGPWSWWAGYSWSEAEDEFAGFDTDRSWDQRHALNAGVHWARGPWRATLAATWHSGWPFTDLELVPATSGPGYSAARLGPRNASRFADFFSLDLHVDYTWSLPRGSLEAFVDVLNLSNRENDCCRDVEVSGGPDTFDISVQREGWMTIVPVLGLNWRF